MRDFQESHQTLSPQRKRKALTTPGRRLTTTCPIKFFLWTITFSGMGLNTTLDNGVEGFSTRQRWGGINLDKILFYLVLVIVLWIETDEWEQRKLFSGTFLGSNIYIGRQYIDASIGTVLQQWLRIIILIRIDVILF